MDQRTYVGLFGGTFRVVFQNISVTLIVFCLADASHTDAIHTVASQGVFFAIADVTVLLSLTVFMNLVSEIMPTTSDAVPLIGRPADVRTKRKKAVPTFLFERPLF
jgi:hypothetical protein